MLDIGPDPGRPRLAALLAVAVGVCSAAAFFAIHGSAEFGGRCLDGGAAPCAEITPALYVTVSALPAMIAAYLFSRPSHWPAAGATWCVPFLAMLAAVRALRLALGSTGGVDWPWLVGALALGALAIGLVVHWARGAGERERSGVGAVLLLMVCAPVGLALGTALTAIVT